MQLSKHIIGGATFSSNFILLSEDSYFGGLSEKKPLLHLWSLAIEEQFYIFWPLVIWFFSKTKLNYLFLSLTLGILSFWLNISGVQKDLVPTFYSPQTRVWELLIGASIASISFTRRQQPLPPILGSICSFSGTALLLISLWVIGKESTFPGAVALLPTLGTALIIWAGPSHWANKLLSFPVLTGLGKISFSMYLWHWPLLSFARIFEYDPLCKSMRISLVLVSLVASWMTYYFIERPTRFRWSTPVIVRIMPVMLFLSGLLGFLIYKNQGYPSRFPQYQNFVNADSGTLFPGNLTQTEINQIPHQSQRSNKNEITLFVGDSNIVQYYPRIDELIRTSPDETNSIIFIQRAGCLPISGANYDGNRHYCNGLMDSAVNLAISKPEVKNVVIAGLWTKYFIDHIGLSSTVQVGDSEYLRLMANLEKDIALLKSHHKKVYLALNIPVGKELDPKFFLYRNIKNFPHFFEIRSQGINKNQELTSFNHLQRDLTQVALKAQAEIIDPTTYLCPNDFCPNLTKEGTPIYSDLQHLSGNYVKTQATFLDFTVRND